ncbi:MAG: M81 family metallopeptidase [Actinobacteria bacterium]|nr:MAG: M81 family metallopeptidase [Actinomycetota bacterium]
MRLAALGLAHETNTFASEATDYASFEESGILRGDEIVRAYAESHATMAGFLEARETLGRRDRACLRGVARDDGGLPGGAGNAGRRRGATAVHVHQSHWHDHV